MGHARSPAMVAAIAALLLLAIGPRPAGAVEDRLLGRRLKDAAITAVVKARLVAARPANLTGIDVDTDEGVVRLTGAVPGPDEWAEAQRLAETAPGVQRVLNTLRIEEPDRPPGERQGRLGVRRAQA